LVFYGNITGDGAGFLIFLLWSFQAKAASLPSNDHSAIF
jgi:hypothetical protein